MIGFILTMPNVGSWNGKWTGENDLHYIYRKLSKQKEIELNGKSFYYNFGDGWGADVECKMVDYKTNNKLKKNQVVFVVMIGW